METNNDATHKVVEKEINDPKVLHATITENESEEPKQKQSKKCRTQSICDSTAVIGWGFLFGIGMCFVLVLAGSLHWSESSVCAFIKSADQKPRDYPQPRCVDTERFRNKTEIDTQGFYYYWRLPKMTWQGQFSAWIGYSLHQVSVRVMEVTTLCTHSPHFFLTEHCMQYSRAVVNMDPPVSRTKKVFQRLNSEAR